MNLYFTLASYAVAASVGAGAVGVWKNLEIANIELERKDERIASQRAARTQAEIRLATQHKKEVAAQARTERLAAVVADNRTELERLRDATDAAMRAASTSLEACTAHAATQGRLLNHCSGRLVDVSARADGHVSDIKTLTEEPQE